jgi:hypothetical protein
MENYKIKVNNEAESKEAQDLFEQLGFMWASDYPENGDWYSHLYAEKSSYCHLPIYVWNGLGDKFQELTLPQLRDLVAKRKPTEQSLISGADALRALADGEEVEFKDGMNKWENIKYHMNLDLSMFLTAPDWMNFRLKPRTITLNVEIPAPFEPKENDIFWTLSTNYECGYVQILCYRNDKQGNRFRH